ncbi:MAG TPA: hypothetical protein VNA20_18045 [Frankiaceae bacterium]|nr:hypothetical protein [Frankiaceae bacterium]
MIKKLAMAALAVGALALNAPAAQADAPTVDCRLRSVQQDTVTGQTFQGALGGVIAHSDPTTVTIKCRVTVNGVTAASTDTGTGVGVAATAKDISFAAGDADVVKVCADFTSSHGSGTICVTIGIIQVPPQVVYDTLDPVLDVVWGTVDPVVCAELKKLAGSYAGGAIVINSQGDVYVNNAPQYDCPPYDIVW